MFAAAIVVLLLQEEFPFFGLPPASLNTKNSN